MHFCINTKEEVMIGIIPWGHKKRLVQDEIVSVSNGNVKEYQKLAVATLSNGQVSVSAKVTVSVNKLIAYAKSKGSRAEFAGQAFSANLKIMQLRAKSTQQTIDLMIQQLDMIANDMFDFKLILGEPQNLSGKYYFFPTIEVYSNEASTNFYNILTQTLSTLNLSEADREFCRNIMNQNAQVFPLFSLQSR